MKNFFETENIEFLAGFDFLDLCLLGETGTGKTHLAERIHALSPRAGKPFVAVNCAELSPTIIESELFGAEKGAFTGAFATKIGKFEAAQGGTLFLDEIGELPANLQAKLLKVVEEKKVTRVGGIRTHAVDVRIIYATHRDLDVFREDFRYRIAAHPIALKPLRARRDEIAGLARRFFADFSRKSSWTVTAEPRALRLLEAFDWPGNVRELRAFVESIGLAAVFEAARQDSSDERTVTITDAEIRAGLRSLTADHSSASNVVDFRLGRFPAGGRMTEVMDRIEGEIISRALEENGNNQSRAARHLGISRGGLIKKMKRVALL